MCHEDTSSVSQVFKSNHAHTQRTQSEQNQWKSNQSLLHVPEHGVMADVGGVLVSGAKPPSSCNYTSNKYPREMEVRTYILFIRHQLVAVRRKKAEQHKIVRISPFYTHTKLAQ